MKLHRSQRTRRGWDGLCSADCCWHLNSAVFPRAQLSTWTLGKSVSLHSLLSVWQLLHYKGGGAGLDKQIYIGNSFSLLSGKQGHLLNLEFSLSNLAPLQNLHRLTPIITWEEFINWAILLLAFNTKPWRISLWSTSNLVVHCIICVVYSGTSVNSNAARMWKWPCVVSLLFTETTFKSNV